MQLVGTWLQERLPRLDPVVAGRFIHVTAGVFEAQSALVEAIAASSAFQALEDRSNFTRVQRMLQDLRRTLETVYVPLVQHLLAELHPASLDLTSDEVSHADDFGLFQVSVATDGMVLPLGWVLYQPDAA